MKKFFYNIDDLVAVLAFVGIITITFLNVLSRYLLNSPILWGEEVSLALYVWVVFIGSSSTMKRDGHIGISYFVDKLPQKIRNIMIALKNIIISVILIYVFIFLGSALTLQASDKVTPILNMSYIWVDIAVVFGGILMLYHFINNLNGSLGNRQVMGGED